MFGYTSGVLVPSKFEVIVMKQNSIDEITIKSSGEINPKSGTNTRILYEHQKNAMACLDIMNKEKAYSTLVVLPTGGGKTYTEERSVPKVQKLGQKGVSLLSKFQHF